MSTVLLLKIYHNLIWGIDLFAKTASVTDVFEINAQLWVNIWKRGLRPITTYCIFKNSELPILYLLYNIISETLSFLYYGMCCLGCNWDFALTFWSLLLVSWFLSCSKSDARHQREDLKVNCKQKQKVLVEVNVKMSLLVFKWSFKTEGLVQSQFQSPHTSFIFGRTQLTFVVFFVIFSARGGRGQLPLMSHTFSTF